jgi:hypothetical protein
MQEVEIVSCGSKGDVSGPSVPTEMLHIAMPMMVMTRLRL